MTPASSRVGVLLLLVVVTAGGCGGTTSGSALDPDDLELKMMRYQQVRMHQRQFYVGMSRGPNLQSATREAYREITRQLTWLPAGLESAMEGLYRVDRSATDSEGKVHVLAVLHREACADYLRKMREDRRRRLQKHIDGCEKKVSVGERAAARSCLGSTRRELAVASALNAAIYASVGDPAPTSALPEQRSLASLVKRFEALDMTGKTVLLHLLRTVDRRVTGNLNASASEVLSGSGLKLISTPLRNRAVKKALSGDAARVAKMGRKRGAGYVIVGEVRARFLNSDMGQYFASGSGEIKVIETVNGRVVDEMTVDGIKGGHISRKQACAKAIDKAAEQLLEKLRAAASNLSRH